MVRLTQIRRTAGRGLPLAREEEEEADDGGMEKARGPSPRSVTTCFYRARADPGGDRHPRVTRETSSPRRALPQIRESQAVSRIFAGGDLRLAFGHPPGAFP